MRLLLLGGVALALSAALVAWTLAHLGHPAVVARAAAVIAAQTGLEVRWTGGEVSTQAAVLRGLRVASAPQDRAVAPHLLVVDEVRMPLNLPALRRGALRAEGIEVRGVRVHVVVDATGATSVQRLLPPQGPAAPPSAPTSPLRALDALPQDLRASLRVSDIQVTVSHTTSSGAVARALTLVGVDVRGSAQSVRAPRTADLTLTGPTRVTATAADPRHGPWGLPLLRGQRLDLPAAATPTVAELTRALAPLNGPWTVQLAHVSHVDIVNGDHVRLTTRAGSDDAAKLPGAPTQLVDLDLRVTEPKPRTLHLAVPTLKVPAMKGTAAASVALAPDYATWVSARDVAVSATMEPAAWLAWIPGVSVADLRIAFRLRIPHLSAANPTAAHVAATLSASGDRLQLRPRLPGVPSASFEAQHVRATVTATLNGDPSAADSAARKGRQPQGGARARVSVTGALERGRARYDRWTASWHNLALPALVASAAAPARTAAPPPGSPGRAPTGRPAATTRGAGAKLGPWRLSAARLDASARALHASQRGASGPGPRRGSGAATAPAPADAASAPAALRMTGDLQAHVTGERGGYALHLTAAGDGDVSSLAGQATATGVRVTSTATVSDDGATVSAASLHVSADHGRTSVQRAAVHALDVTSSLTGLSHRDGAVRLDRASFKASARSVSAGGVRVDEHPAASATLTDARVDLAEPLRATGAVAVRGKALGNRLSLDLTRKATPLSWSLKAEAPRLGALLRLLPLSPAVARALRKTALSATSEGVVTRPTAPLTAAIRHRSDGRLSGFAGVFGGVALSAGAIRVEASGDQLGSRSRQRATLELVGPRVAHWRGRGRHVARATLLVDPNRGVVNLDATASLPAGPKLAGTLNLRHEGGQAVLRWDLSSSKLRALALTVPRDLRDAACVDLRRLSGLWRGALRVPMARRRLFDAATWTRALTSAPHLELDQTLAVRGLRCRKPTLAMATPEVALNTKVRLRGARIVVTGNATMKRLRGHVQDRRVELRGLDQGFRVEATLPPGQATLTLDGRIARLDQDLVPAWQVADARLTGVIRAAHAQSVRVEALTFDNPKAGTVISGTGGLDWGGGLGAAPSPFARRGDSGRVPGGQPASPASATTRSLPGRRGLALRGTLTQDMAKMAAATDQLKAAGKVVVPYRLESGDLKVFRLQARPTFRAVDLAFPAWKLAIQGLEGAVPLYEDVEITRGGARLLGGGAHNAYSRWRFQDHQAFLTGDHFVSVARITYGEATFGPVAGNAVLDRNVFRIDQLEAKVLSGQVTGQCIVDYQGKDSVVLFRGNATGLVPPGTSERMDLNAAMSFQPGQLALSGRAQLLRASRVHLEMLLDLYDPYHQDVQTNKLRLLLKVGHPEQVRMVFRHGFMDFFIDLAGLANVVKIDEIRGIPLGPVMQRWVAPMLPK